VASAKFSFAARQRITSVSEKQLQAGAAAACIRPLPALAHGALRTACTNPEGSKRGVLRRPPRGCEMIILSTDQRNLALQETIFCFVVCLYLAKFAARSKRKSRSTFRLGQTVTLRSVGLGSNVWCGEFLAGSASGWACAVW
jgi:hypothetical protein